MVLAIGSYAGCLSTENILIIVFVIGTTRSFEGPTMQAFLLGLGSTKLIPRAITLASSSNQTATIIGLALGGFLYVVGPTTVYCAVGVLFLTASLLVAMIRIKQISSQCDSINPQSLFAGVDFIRSKPIILGAISLDLFAVLLGGATSLLPIYTQDILFIGPQGLGILSSAPAIGALIMSLFLVHYPLQKRVGRLMFTAVIIFGMATIAFAVSTSLLLSLSALAVLGAANVISVDIAIIPLNNLSN